MKFESWRQALAAFTMKSGSDFIRRQMFAAFSL
jgi:hypothetical protein